MHNDTNPLSHTSGGVAGTRAINLHCVWLISVAATDHLYIWHVYMGDAEFMAQLQNFDTTRCDLNHNIFINITYFIIDAKNTVLNYKY